MPAVAPRPKRENSQLPEHAYQPNKAASHEQPGSEPTFVTDYSEEEGYQHIAEELVEDITDNRKELSGNEGDTVIGKCNVYHNLMYTENYYLDFNVVLIEDVATQLSAIELQYELDYKDGKTAKNGSIARIELNKARQTAEIKSVNPNRAYKPEVQKNLARYAHLRREEDVSSFIVNLLLSVVSYLPGIALRNIKTMNGDVQLGSDDDYFDKLQLVVDMYKSSWKRSNHDLRTYNLRGPDYVQIAKALEDNLNPNMYDFDTESTYTLYQNKSKTEDDVDYKITIFFHLEVQEKRAAELDLRFKTAYDTFPQNNTTGSIADMTIYLDTKNAELNGFFWGIKERNRNNTLVRKHLKQWASSMDRTTPGLVMELMMQVAYHLPTYGLKANPESTVTLSDAWESRNDVNSEQIVQYLSGVELPNHTVKKIKGMLNGLKGRQGRRPDEHGYYGMYGFKDSGNGTSKVLKLTEFTPTRSFVVTTAKNIDFAEVQTC